MKLIKDKYEILKTDWQADSYQKDLLCQRVVFVSIQLESMEVKATRMEEFNANVYSQLVSTFMRLLTFSALERKVKQVESLETYVKSKRRTA